MLGCGLQGNQGAGATKASEAAAEAAKKGTGATPARVVLCLVHCMQTLVAIHAIAEFSIMVLLGITVSRKRDLCMMFGQYP